MERIVGLLLMLVAIVVGAGTVGWLGFTGIVGIIEAVKAGWIAVDIAIGVCKILLGIPIVTYICYLIGAIGFIMFF